LTVETGSHRQLSAIAEKVCDGPFRIIGDCDRRLETQRLDALQVTLWDRAVSGDTAAGHEVLHVIRTRCRLLGLDLSRKPSAGPAIGPPGPLSSPKRNGKHWVCECAGQSRSRPRGRPHCP
jgi:hypothetical protein